MSRVTNGLPRRRLKFLAVMPVLAVALLATAAPAAAFRTGAYVTKAKDFVAAGHSSAGGKLSCPSGKSVVSGGAFWVGFPDTAFLASSLPLNGHSWFVAGLNHTSSSATLRVVINCLASTSVGSYVIVRHDFAASSTEGSGGYVSCPVGYRIVTGGAGWKTPGDPFVASLAHDYWLGGSTPTTDAAGWYADGRPFTSANGAVLRVVALCRPKSSVGTYSVKTLTLQAPGGVGYRSVGNYLSCATGRVVASGAYWHDPGTGPDPTQASHYMINSLTPTTDAKGMWGSGSVDENHLLTLVVLCRPI